MRNRLNFRSTKIGMVFLALMFAGCAAVSWKTPGPPEYAVLAENLSKTIIVFAPRSMTSEILKWKPTVLEVKGKLESLEPVTAQYVKEKVFTHLVGYLNGIFGDSKLTEAQKRVLLDDFADIVNLVLVVEGEIELDPDQMTIILGAVTGILDGIRAIEIPLMGQGANV